MRKLFLTLATVAAMSSVYNSVDEKYTTETPHEQPIQVEAFASPGEIVIDVVDGYDSLKIMQLSDLLDANVHLSSVESKDNMLLVAEVDNMALALQRLKTVDYVEAAEQNHFYTSQGWFVASKPNDPLYEKQWHLPMMGADVAWDISPKGKGVVVAVLDTGVSKVEDLAKERLLDGKSFVPRQSVDDGNGHGTHVAGTIAQTTNNGIGAAGVAPEATILPVKVLSDEGFGQVDWIADGIDYAVDNGAQVINMSLGGGYSPVIHKAVQKAVEAGVVVVAACGNSSVAQCGYPGGLKETIGVSALGPDGNLAFYSSYGKGVDIAAPGGNKKFKDGGVWQNTILDGKEGYYDFQGTSMASPHVAGAAAVLISAGVKTTDVTDVLTSTADGDEWTPQFGHGKVNLVAALGGAKHSKSFVWQSSAAAVLLTMLLAFLTKLDWKFNVSTAATAATVAGGFWMLQLLPLPNWFIFQWLTVSPIHWVSMLFGDFWGTSPLVLGAFVPLTLSYVLGPVNGTRSMLSGLNLGWAAYLTWYAAAGLSMSMLPVVVVMPWLVLNTAALVFATTALYGIEAVRSNKL